jgi:hypothetical protein
MPLLRRWLDESTPKTASRIEHAPDERHPDKQLFHTIMFISCHERNMYRYRMYGHFVCNYVYGVAMPVRYPYTAARIFGFSDRGSLSAVDRMWGRDGAVVANLLNGRVKNL